MAGTLQTKEEGPAFIRPAESAAEESTPDLGGTKRGAELPPQGQPAPPFYLAAHPNRFVVMDGRVIPFARTIVLSRGVGGVDVDQQGRPKPSIAIAEAEEQGWKVIPWDVDGRGTSYLKRVKSTGGWVTKWTTLHPGTERITVDEKGYADFWMRRIKEGLIDPPAPWVLDSLDGSLRNALENEQKNHPDVKTTRRMQLLEQLEAVARAREEYGSAGASAEEATPNVG